MSPVRSRTESTTPFPCEQLAEIEKERQRNFSRRGFRYSGMGG